MRGEDVVAMGAAEHAGGESAIVEVGISLQGVDDSNDVLFLRHTRASGVVAVKFRFSAQECKFLKRDCSLIRKCEYA